jgi:glutamate dehydrogenase
MTATSHINKILEKSSDKLYKNYVENLYSYVPSDYSKYLTLEEVESIAKFSYDRILNFSDSRKIDYSNIKTANNSNTFFNICGSNVAFLVDTIKNLLSENSLSIKYIFHPIIHTSRDSNGKLNNIEKSYGVDDESVIVLVLNNSLDENQADALKNSLEKALDNAVIINESWKDILIKVENTSNKLAQENTQKNNSALMEARNFLNWIITDNFTFIAIAEIDVKNEKFIEKIGSSEIWNEDNDFSLLLSKQNDHNNIIEFGKINVTSAIYKNYYYDSIKINFFDENNNNISSVVIIGVFSFMLDFQSVSTIPILRDKYDYVKLKSDFPDKGHNFKKTRIIIESIPRVALLHTSSEKLYDLTNEVLSSILVGNVKIFCIGNCIQNFIEILIFLPRIKYSHSIHQKIQNYLQKRFSVNITRDYVSELGQEFIFIYSTFASNFCAGLNENETFEIQKDIEKMISNWTDELADEIKLYTEKTQKHLEFIKFANCFPSDYQFNHSISEAISDIENLVELSEDNKVIYKLENKNDKFFLKIYSSIGKLSISDTTPILENLGFKVIEEQSYNLLNSPENYIHIYTIETKFEIVNFQEIKRLVEEKLVAIQKGLTKADELSKLISYSLVSWREIDLLRAFANYMHQTNFLYDYKYVSSNLIKHHNFTKKLLSLFNLKFNPKEYNLRKLELLQIEIDEYIQSVDNGAEDKVLITINLILKAAIRTNYYQKRDADFKDYISIKFDSSKVPNLQKPIPFAEIFVFSHDFEGIHLRGGKVSRGGLRWSDRGEDYRTEVFGLMKAQMTKNTVIVPEGSKGGFYTKFSVEDCSREEYMEKSISCYKNFLRGLLDITDNIKEGDIITPLNTITYDEKDPYLVVAADKGTATFSDYANQVSYEYSFWLGDAFASGGSAGYDHKKMGITAKGGWISVQRHFKERGIDVQTDNITVIGIGDMSGDVFGNGMLLSKSIKLVAAFNHMHIFLDPSPNPEISFNERQRLFNLPRSKWSDYDKSLISKGGGIFERSARKIEISTEVKKLFSIEQDSLPTEDLLRILLTSEVDLIWNGGIGTYMKASDEQDYKIGDKSNDAIRVLGRDLKAKCFGEGGNLGVSQLGRIEYAKSGGMINTDFIDNSAGVDCSDHEVNIKIALAKALENNKINLDSRNKILEQMTESVSELVLQDNKYQTLAISFMQHSTAFTVESFMRLIDNLEEQKLLQREVEFLPSSSELMTRAKNGEKLTRPELSVILSYSKMMVYKNLESSKVSSDSYFNKWLLEYFPEAMREKFLEEIQSHPLKNQIILTIITNKLVNQLSGPILNNLIQDTGALLCDVVRGFVIVQEIFCTDQILDEVDRLPKNIPLSNSIDIYTDLNKVVRRGITWMINNLDHPLKINESIEKYRDITLKVSKILSQNIVGANKEKYDAKINSCIEAGINLDLAGKYAKLETLVSSFDIAHIHITTGADIKSLCSAYFKIANVYSIDWLRKSCDRLMNDSYWQSVSLQTLKDDLYDKQRRILRRVVNSEMCDNVEKWIEKNENYAEIFNGFIKNLMKHDVIDISMLIIANKKLEMFIRKS